MNVIRRENGIYEEMGAYICDLFCALIQYNRVIELSKISDFFPKEEIFLIMLSDRKRMKRVTV